MTLCSFALLLIHSVEFGRTSTYFEKFAASIMSSRGYRVLKFHKNDWLMIVALVIMEGILLHWVPPFYRFIGKDMMTDLKYPFKSNTVPFWAIPVLALVVPILVFLIYYFRKRDLHELHQALLGLLFSVLLTAVITDFIKSAVGRPRPDFFWRCFPDGIELYDKRTHNVKCTGNHADIKEGHKSFPSGHTSGCFAGLGYLSWYLAGKINLFNKKAHAGKLCIVFPPLLIASLVGISRVDDYWHHWQDVFAGGLLGFSIATLCYRQFFPAPYHLDGMLPYPFFPEITEQHLNERENTNALHQQNSGAQNEPFRTGKTEAEEREGIEGCKNNRSSDTEIEMIRSGARSNPTVREVLETKASLDNV